MPYIGRTLGQGTRSRFLYTATAGQTTFSGSDTQSNTLAYSDNNGVDCFQNGVLLKGGGADYTATSGTSVVLTTGASVNDVIEILVYDVFAIADHVKKSGDAMTGALTNIDVNGTELVLDADGDTSITADTDDQIDIKVGGTDRAVFLANNMHLIGGTVARIQLSSSGTGTTPNTGNNNVHVEGNDDTLVLNAAGNGQIIFQEDGTERMRIDTSGNLGVGVTSMVGSGRLYSSGSYSATTGLGANMVIESNGLISRSTSSQRYKNTIADASHGLAELMKLRAVTYKHNSNGDTTFGGLIAEEVHDAGLTEFVQYDDEGKPDALAYGNMVSLCIKAIQQLSAKVETLEAKVTALESK